MIMLLGGCDLMTPKSYEAGTCQTIALGRLKHPGSFEESSLLEKNNMDDQKLVQISFQAWNDYKVPMPHIIECMFNMTDEQSTSALLAIKWNGRSIRQHELDQIREKVNQTPHP